MQDDWTHNPPVLGSSPSRPTGNGFLTGWGFQPTARLSGILFDTGISGGLVTDWSRVSAHPVVRSGPLLLRLSRSGPFLRVHGLRHLEGQVMNNATLAADEIRRLPAALTV